MSIESLCQTCGNRLRVAEEHAGKLARCPKCQTVYTVPIPGAVAAPQAIGQPVGEMWRMKGVDGTVYGPVSRDELDRWLGEGRITAMTRLRRESEEGWRRASEVYPQLGSAGAFASSSVSPFAPGQPVRGIAGSPFVAGGAYAPVSSNPFAERGQDPYAPTVAAGYMTDSMGRVMRPHRGPLILVFGVLAIAVCFVFAFPALIMGLHDLRQMRLGLMDPSGKGLTIAGTVLGGLWMVLAGLWVLFIFGTAILNN